MSVPLQQAASSRTLSRSRLALLLFALVTTLTIAGQTWWAIEQDRRQTLTSETNNGLIAVRLLEEHASQTLQDAIHTLDRVAQAVLTADHYEDPTLIRSIVASHDIGQSRYLKAVQYVTPQGIGWISSPDYPTHQTEVSHRSHIQYLLKHPTDHGAMVGHPYASAYDSQWVIPVARSLYDKRDQTVGVISVDIRLSYFGALYSRVAKENNASVTLLSNQGFILARSPFEARYVDRDVTDEPKLALLRNTVVEGSFDDETFLDDDDGPKLYTFRKLTGFPITMVYARDYATVLAPWHQRTFERLLMAVFSIALVATLTYILYAYIRRLQRTQSSLRESEAKFFGLFRQSPVPHTLVRSMDGQFVEANDAWLQQYGYQLQDVIGHNARDLGIWVNPLQREQLVAALVPGGRVDRVEVEHRHHDGHTIICLVSGRTVMTGSEKLTLFTLEDVTRQRTAEREIRTMNQELEQRVKARTEKLEIANRELSVALASVQTMQTEMVRTEKLAALGSLVAGVAHELNTPIGNSVTVGSTLQYQVKDLTDAFSKGELRRSTLQVFLENAQRGTDILMRALTRASELIRSFKRVAVDQSSDQRRVFDLQITLREVCLTLEPMYKNSPFDLTLALPDVVEMDSFPGALGQLITNFVSNALQHGFDGRERGQMHVRAVAAGPENVTLQFSDDGIGMTEDTRNRVFDPFFTTKLGQGGSGLGMNIVYNIVHDVLGGSIEIASSPDAGTLITVHLPRCAPRATGE
ncbi:MAG: ATP-binding protein [Rhodoferax sp.]